MKIGERIKSTRIDKDQTQKQIGEILGVTEKQISRWGKDTQEMGIWKLKDFCLYYHVSADYILGLPEDLEWPR